MSPEYIESLADLADPGQLWRLSPLTELTIEQSRQRDTGIALRRHASHVREVLSLLGTGRSLCITPLSTNSTRTGSIPTPERHQRSVDAVEFRRILQLRSSP